MRATTIFSVLAILILLSPLACPLIASAKTEYSSHACPSDPQKQQDEGRHTCCNQQAVVSKAVETVGAGSVEMLLPLDLTIVESVLVHAFQDFPQHLHLKKWDLISKFCVLRI